MITTKVIWLMKQPLPCMMSCSMSLHKLKIVILIMRIKSITNLSLSYYLNPLTSNLKLVKHINKDH